MRVFFIYPFPPPLLQPTCFGQGIGYISAALKKAGHKTRGIIVHQLEKERIEEELSRFNPQLVAISTTYDQFPLTEEVCSFLAEIDAPPVVIGGIHATTCPEECLGISNVIGACRGEGEEAMVEFVSLLARKEDCSGVKNFWLRRQGKLIRNPLRPLIDDLNALPFPDRELIDFQRLVDIQHEAQFMAGRGCPYQCTYCVNHYLMREYKGRGRFIRMRDVDNIITEIEQVLTRYRGIEHIGFDDDIFILDREWLSRFAEEYPRRVGIPFWCNARVNLVDEEVVSLLKKAGCFQVKMGVESGNPRIRNEVLNRKIKDEEIIRAFDLVHKAGIECWSFNMIGLPYETEETILDTIRLNRKIKSDLMSLSVFHPYPETESYHLVKKEGWLTNKVISSYFDSKPVIALTTADEQVIVDYFHIFREMVKKGEEGYFFSYGWHAWEEENGTRFRWSKKEAEILIKSNKKPEALSFTLSAHFPDLKSRPLTVHFTVDGEERLRLTLDNDSPQRVTVLLPGVTGKFIRLRMHLSYAIVPARDLGAADPREIGIKARDFELSYKKGLASRLLGD
jgi:anaerobic magnesium-protoporphyrin IX monomethyl ester cyclase